MITKRFFLRAGAIVFAVLLLSGYVYDRAGGQLLEKVGLRKKPGPTEAELIMLSGSKTALVVDPNTTTLMPGSKSAMVIEPAPEAAQLISVPPGTKLLPGSKSFIIAEPQTGNAPQNNPPPAPPKREQLEIPSRFLPGSKSDVIFEPQAVKPGPLPKNSSAP